MENSTVTPKGRLLEAVFVVLNCCVGVDRARLPENWREKRYTGGRGPAIDLARKSDGFTTDRQTDFDRFKLKFLDKKVSTIRVQICFRSEISEGNGCRKTVETKKLHVE